MKRIISFGLILFLLFSTIPFSAFAALPTDESGFCGDNITWAFDASTQVLTINGTGEMYVWEYYDDTPWYDLNKFVVSVVIGEGVTDIGKYAFFGLEALSNIEIPESVVSIKESVFVQCRLLTDVYYAGSEDMWDRITIGRSNDYLEKADILFGKPSVVYGDVNGDGRISISDVLYVRKYIANIVYQINVEAADVDGNGRISIADVLLIRKYIANIINSFPAGKPTAPTKNIVINTDDFICNEMGNQYYLLEQKETLNGRIEEIDGIVKATCTITDCNDTELFSEDFNVSSEWVLEDVGFVVGENNVKISVRYDDGGYDSSSIVVNNLCEENMDGLQIDRGDNDNDGVINYIETIKHTDCDNEDSDDDGLTDYDEIAVLGTDPLIADTDNDGIIDSSEDSDGDGLSNFDEIYIHGTQPITVDTDGDGLSDYDEIINYETFPSDPDTDDDGASDYWELENGFDPLVFNASFGDVSSEDSSATASEDGVEITAIIYDAFLNEYTPGYMGINPYQISLGDAQSSDISIPFDPSILDPEDQPVIYYFNEDTQRLEELPTTIDENGNAVATVDKDGFYILLNRRYVYDVWENDIIPPSLGNAENGSIDIVFVIDRSASMDSNDPEGIRKEVVKEFIRKLRDNDRAAVVQFTAIAETIMPMTKDKQALIEAVDSIENSDGGGCAGSDANAGTNGAAGIRNALDQLVESTAPYKYIVFLTDGDDTTTPEGYTYEDLQNEAKGRVIIHTIGLVGTGSVNTDLLKQIAAATYGNYYLATTGSEAENVPEDVLGLEDVYDDIENITFDRATDSNDDGITDYYTKLICEGILVTSKGNLVFDGATFDEVQKNADFDGDGLLNGEEVIIRESESGVYAKIVSYPYLTDTDQDSLDDYSEVKFLNTSPLKYNSYVNRADVDWITNEDNFMSSAYLNLYNDSILEQSSVKIGNAFFGNKLNQTHIYQAELVEFFETITAQEATLNEAKNNQQLVEDVISAMTAEYIAAIVEATNESSKEEAIEIFNDFCNFAGFVKNLIAPSDKLLVVIPQLEKVKIINFINAGNSSMAKYYLDLSASYLDDMRSFVAPSIWTSEKSKTYLNQLNNRYLASLDEHSKLSSKIEINNSRFDAISTGLDIVFSVISVGISAVESCIEYNKLMANLEAVKNNIYILDSILADPETNVYLKSAASNIKSYFVNVYNEDVLIVKEFVMHCDYALPALETALTEILHFAIASNPVGAVIELGRSLANIMGMDKLCEQASKTVASAQTAKVLSKIYNNKLNGGNAVLCNAENGDELWISYSDYSANIYKELLNVVSIRIISETEVSAKEFQQPESVVTSASNNISVLTTAVTIYFSKLINYTVKAGG